MTRPLRFLTTRLNSTSSSSSTAASVVAEPPEAVAAESDFVVILAALLCALICVIGLLSVARCAWLRRSAASNGRPSARSNRGLKKKTLQSLPKLTYDAAAAAAEAKFSAECAICLTEYADGDEIRDLPQCGHRFHVGCIDTWLGSHSSCPSCRQILVAARCGKCGELPAIYGAGSQAEAEAEMKAREDREGSSSGCLPDHRV